jgi:hypothetical protein
VVGTCDVTTLVLVVKDADRHILSIARFIYAQSAKYAQKV